MEGEIGRVQLALHNSDYVSNFNNEIVGTCLGKSLRDRFFPRNAEDDRVGARLIAANPLDVAVRRLGASPICGWDVSLRLEPRALKGRISVSRLA